jgi:hypothetical protein
MKKNNNLILESAITFFLVAILMVVIPFGGNAQQNDPPLFALVECMKVMPENENLYVDLEKNIWKPMHQERVRQGNIAGWYLYKVRYTGTGDSYNYVTVTLFTDPLKIENPWKNIDPGKILPGKDLDKILSQTIESRDMVSSSLINRSASVYQDGGPGDFKYIQVDFMKVGQGMGGEYYDTETKIWKAVHQEFIKAGSRVGWSLWERNYPSGASLDFQYITVNYLKNWSQIGAANYNDAFAKAHAGKDLNALFEKTNASRELIRSELWEVIDKTLAP